MAKGRSPSLHPDLPAFPCRAIPNAGNQCPINLETKGFHESNTTMCHTMLLMAPVLNTAVNMPSALQELRESNSELADRKGAHLWLGTVSQQLPENWSQHLRQVRTTSSLTQHINTTLSSWTSLDVSVDCRHQWLFTQASLASDA